MTKSHGSAMKRFVSHRSMSASGKGAATRFEESQLTYQVAREECLIAVFMRSGAARRREVARKKARKNSSNQRASRLNGSDNLGLAADHPTLGTRRW